MAHVDWLGDVQKTNHKIVNSMYYKTTISIPITKKKRKCPNLKFIIVLLLKEEENDALRVWCINTCNGRKIFRHVMTNFNTTMLWWAVWLLRDISRNIELRCLAFLVLQD